MRILAFDTSAEACTAALLCEGQCHVREEHTPRKHAQTLLPFIRDLLSEHQTSLQDLDAIAFGCGPGSFTGLRIAAGVAQGLSFGSDCPVLPVSNLRAMALRATEQSDANYILPAFDARKDEVYWGVYKVLREDGSKGVLDIELQGQEHVSGPENLEVQIDSADATALYGLGGGYTFHARFPDRLKTLLSSFDDSAIPHARDIAMLARLDLGLGRQGVMAHDAKPSYVRDEVAWKKLPGRA